MQEKKGYVSFVLHAHLPFIHHPESDDYLEESWLYEAISETYIPLLTNFQKLVDEGVDFRITMSMTPPLLSMLDNKLLQRKYIKYLKRLIELSEKEIKRTAGDERLNKLSHYYFDRYSNDLHLFKDVYNCNLIDAFKHFQDVGVLEIITCGATHGYFPILYVNEKTVKAQIAVGVQTYERYFGKKPRGIWLPECGYVPEADKYLKEFGIDYIITESHGILYADPTPIYGTFAPIVSPKGVIAFGRDIESSQQVWSSIDGYPGDFNYREFYRDIGYEADYDYIKPYIAHNGVRVHTGIKYYRITGKILKIIIIFNGQKIQLKDKLVISWILEQTKLIIYPNIWIHPLLYFVLMMLNFMDIGGMKVLIGYIFYLKKFIMMIVILS